MLRCLPGSSKAIIANSGGRHFSQFTDHPELVPTSRPRPTLRPRPKPRAIHELALKWPPRSSQVQLKKLHSPLGLSFDNLVGVGLGPGPGPGPCVGLGSGVGPHGPHFGQAKMPRCLPGSWSAVLISSMTALGLFLGQGPSPGPSLERSVNRPKRPNAIQTETWIHCIRVATGFAFG